MKCSSKVIYGNLYLDDISSFCINRFKRLISNNPLELRLPYDYELDEAINIGIITNAYMLDNTIRVEFSLYHDLPDWLELDDIINTRLLYSGRRLYTNGQCRIRSIELSRNSYRMRTPLVAEGPIAYLMMAEVRSFDELTSPIKESIFSNFIKCIMTRVMS